MGKIIYTALSAIFLILTIYFTLDRIKFDEKSRKTKGTVVAITSINEGCRRKNGAVNDCTKYAATVQFTIDETKQTQSFFVDAGSIQGRDQPASKAIYKTGETLSVVYDKMNPSVAFLDSIWSVWAAPAAMFLGFLFFFLVRTIESIDIKKYMRTKKIIVSSQHIEVK